MILKKRKIQALSISGHGPLSLAYQCWFFPSCETPLLPQLLGHSSALVLLSSGSESSSHTLIQEFPKELFWPPSLPIYPLSLGKLFQSNVSSNHLEKKDSKIHPHDTLFSSLQLYSQVPPPISHLKSTCICKTACNVFSSETISLSVSSLILSRHHQTPGNLKSKCYRWHPCHPRWNVLLILFSQILFVCALFPLTASHPP